MKTRVLAALMVFGHLVAANRKPAAEPRPEIPVMPRVESSAGSLFVPGGRYSDLVRDLRASQPGDIVTVLVADRASAVSRGTTATKRKSSARASVNALAGPTRAAGPWANLAGVSGDQSLDGQGATTRDSSLLTTISLQVVAVTPAGNLVLQGSKQVQVNSERQTVSLRGVVRPADLSPANTVQSDRLAELEIFVNGRGVVGDAVRRPFFLYRLLLGLLPF